MIPITPSPSIRLNIRRDENDEPSSSLSFVQYTSKQVTKHLPSAVLDESEQTTVKNNNQQYFISPQSDPKDNHTSLTQGDKNQRKLTDRQRKEDKQTYMVQNEDKTMLYLHWTLMLKQLLALRLKLDLRTPEYRLKSGLHLTIPMSRRMTVTVARETLTSLYRFPILQPYSL